MTDPSKKNLRKQHSLSYVEQSLRLIPPPHQGPVTIYPGPKNKAGDLSKADLEIANRLERLRRSSTEMIPSEEEMASRLAQLKGLPSDHYSKPRNIYRPPDNRTQAQQSDDLIKQIMEEVSIDTRAHLSSDDELEEHLDKLKDDATRPYSMSTVPMGFQLPAPIHQGPHHAAGFAQPYHHPSAGVGMEHLSIHEADALMRDAEREAKDAHIALDAAKRDSQVSKPKSMKHKHKLKKEHKKQKKNKDKDHDGVEKEKRKKKLFKRDKKVKASGVEGGDESSSGEFYSDTTSDSESEAKPKRHTQKTATTASLKEKKEVDRIVTMYATQPSSSTTTHKDKKVESSEDDEADSTTTVSDTDTEFTSSDTDDLNTTKKHMVVI